MRSLLPLWIVAAAIFCMVAGAALAQVTDSGVRVEKVMLTPDTPTLRIYPTTPGSHPVALLAHGNGGSKEMFFRFGEALAAAGFDCYSIDQAGYGESPRVCSRSNVRDYFVEAERALGAVDVFIGHSMGGGTGSWSVREAGFRPGRFIGVGYPARLGEHRPPILLAGWFDPFFRPAGLRAEANAGVVISPWSEHILEVYDPVLVRAAVEAACASVGKPVPPVPTAWRWRFAGLMLGIASASVLMFRLPELHPRLARFRRYIIPAVLLIALGLTLGPWVGVTPQWRRIPYQLAMLLVLLLALMGLGRLRLPRWTLAVVTAACAGVCLVVASRYLAVIRFEKSFFLVYTVFCALGISTLVLMPSTLVGRIAARGGSRRDGDIAMAIFASCVIGQFMPLFF